MKFINAPLEQAVAELSDQLSSKLNQGRVLWLISGGSNIQPAVEVMTSLSDKQTANLTVTLVDERYGPVGHPDSNWQKLLEAGFKFRHATAIPVLTSKGLAETVSDFEAELGTAFQQSDYSLALVGIGPDGHTSGILPNSEATKVTGQLTYGYQGPDFMRITTTFDAIQKIDIAVVFAYGESKKSTLTTLRDQSVDLNEQPAQILKQIPEATIYTDQIGDL